MLPYPHLTCPGGRRDGQACIDSPTVASDTASLILSLLLEAWELGTWVLCGWRVAIGDTYPEPERNPPHVMGGSPRGSSEG